MNHRTNQTMRPTSINYNADIMKPVFEIADEIDPWIIFLEIISPWSVSTSLPSFDQFQDVMLFFTYFDPF